jgi:hypothetical protein
VVRRESSFPVLTMRQTLTVIGGWTTASSTVREISSVGVVAVSTKMLVRGKSLEPFGTCQHRACLILEIRNCVLVSGKTRFRLWMLK